MSGGGKTLRCRWFEHFLLIGFYTFLFIIVEFLWNRSSLLVGVGEEKQLLAPIPQPIVEESTINLCPYNPPYIDKETYLANQNWFYDYFQAFCNSCDFEFIREFFGKYLCPFTKHTMKVFMVGANYGWAAANMVEAGNGACAPSKNNSKNHVNPPLFLHGFEAIPQIYSHLTNLSLKKEVTPGFNSVTKWYNFAVTNCHKSFMEFSSDLTGLGGVHNGQYFSDKKSNFIKKGKIESICFSQFAKEKGMDKID